MNAILIDLQYLPPVAYFSAILAADKVIIESHEHFVKQTYRNRCKILTSTKVLALPVPVHHQGKKIPIQELKIDYIQKWQNNHWRSIEAAYRNSPFFDYYSDSLKDIIYSNTQNLFELNNQLLTLCLKYLQIDTPIEYSEKYHIEPESGITDLRSVIHPKKSTLDIQWFDARPYHQIFGKDFATNLSIIDLLFCEGPRALEVLTSSIVTS